MTDLEYYFEKSIIYFTWQKKCCWIKNDFFFCEDFPTFTDYIPKKKKKKRGRPRLGEIREPEPPKRKRKKLHEMDNEPLFSFIRITDDSSFKCSVCDYLTPLKPNLFRHIRMNHQDELQVE